ncbi:MAG: hypothetical protein DRP06_03640, partial [Candidatus Aenigmatarchaeota archaeon]
MKYDIFDGKGEIIKREPTFVDGVNDRLTEAFGRTIKGNLRYATGVDNTWWSSEEYLSTICKIGRIFGIVTPIGIFPDRFDDSYLIIDPKYEIDAREYCRLIE